MTYLIDAGVRCRLSKVRMRPLDVTNSNMTAKFKKLQADLSIFKIIMLEDSTVARLILQNRRFLFISSCCTLKLKIIVM